MEGSKPGASAPGFDFGKKGVGRRGSGVRECLAYG